MDVRFRREMREGDGGGGHSGRRREDVAADGRVVGVVPAAPGRMIQQQISSRLEAILPANANNPSVNLHRDPSPSTARFPGFFDGKERGRKGQGRKEPIPGN